MPPRYRSGLPDTMLWTPSGACPLALPVLCSPLLSGAPHTHVLLMGPQPPLCPSQVLALAAWPQPAALASGLWFYRNAGHAHRNTWPYALPTSPSSPLTHHPRHPDFPAIPKAPRSRAPTVCQAQHKSHLRRPRANPEAQGHLMDEETGSVESADCVGNRRALV